MPDRYAFDIFKDGGLGVDGQRIKDLIQNKSGVESMVVLAEPGDKPLIYGTGGGYVPYSEPTTAYVDPEAGGAHVLAHELGHTSFPTGLKESYIDNVLDYGQPYNPNDIRIRDALSVRDPAKLRYVYEKEIVPTMLEEANAQGVALGTTEALGMGDQEDKDIYKSATEYPESFGYDGLKRLDEGFSPEFEGQPLGIGIFGSPEMREEYYRIMDNIPVRVRRGFLKGKELIQ